MELLNIESELLVYVGLVIFIEGLKDLATEGEVGGVGVGLAAPDTGEAGVVDPPDEVVGVVRPLLPLYRLQLPFPVCTCIDSRL